MGKLFGTDGIRGLANSSIMNVEVASKIGAIIGNKLKSLTSTKRVIIGKDTRLSSYMIENAITSGLLSSGMNVILTGPVPTPAISFLTRSMRCDIGIMISASHNEYIDNGIKFFDANGEKISDQLQYEIEHAYFNCKIDDFFCTPDAIGRAKRIEGMSDRYIEFVKRSFPQGKMLGGIRVVIDCANGANYKIAPDILWELGADIIVIGNEPNGVNINLNCGSTHPSILQQRVIETRADIGIALDGDGDRLIIVDEKGEIADGDQIITAIAMYLKDLDHLNSKYVVATIVSNLGMEKYLNQHGLELIRTDVGDKNVYEAMKKYNSSVGGEQSGHIIMKKFCTTGDGLISALNILSMMTTYNKKASEILNFFEKVPQYLSKIKFDTKPTVDISKDLNSIANEYLKKLPDSKIIIRKSGTENLIRLTIETNDKNYKEIEDEIISKVQAVLKNAGSL
ncbi:phosphoglucosamine mutase [Candidatus Deianiraea vastatrix]|uniref:Phosphoglucosamine mutase n=1 Tax=Candidatus Deianiraea vastatrix TaxID=2163644 RepID=A0A5B8XG88_9RICK|nr:phosphoglucosamine mutase [Candidatus Deianiraea vastatrix]QED23899.1 Phosphoglucosamine mutase [Candidatus Deianiraea vastatrix]